MQEGSRCEDRGKGSEQEHCKTGKQDRAAPEPVRRRTDQELKHSGRDEIKRHSQLYDRVIGIEMPRHRGQGWQEDVHRKRARRRCHHQREDVRWGRRAVGERHRHRVEMNTLIMGCE
jgi:hypothetical protein